MNTAILEPAPARTGGAPAGKYLTFVLGSESYGIPVSHVREIVRMPEVTPVPETPAYVRGVLNLRGRIIPVIDLRRRFRLSDDGIGARTCVLVIQTTSPEGRALPMGLVVDGVEEVTGIGADQMEEAPRFGARFRADYLLGIAKVEGTVKILVDIDAVLSEELPDGVSSALTGSAPGRPPLPG